MRTWVFISKLVNDTHYKHNEEEVELLGLEGAHAKVRFLDGEEAYVYATEVRRIDK